MINRNRQIIGMTISPEQEQIERLAYALGVSLVTMRGWRARPSGVSLSRAALGGGQGAGARARSGRVRSDHCLVAPAELQMNGLTNGRPVFFASSA